MKWPRFHADYFLPAEDDDHPVRTMMKGWLSFMIPFAWVTWMHTKSYILAGCAFVSPFCISVVQGSIAVFQYRVYFGGAPLPHSPAHGVVVVNPKDAVVQDMNAGGSPCHEGGCRCQGGRRWRNSIPVKEEEKALLQRALKEPPLRLLVIGDSLAIGVGMERSCSPLLPEVIAKTLSKAMGGRAVFWSCHGSPGATASWIVRELENGIQSKASLGGEESNLSLCETDSSSSEEDSVVYSSSSSKEDEQDSQEPEEWKEWRKRLRHHRRHFDPNGIGPYDVAVVLTGSNDLKLAVLPFLNFENDEDFRGQTEEGSSYGRELRKIMEVLRMRMQSEIDQWRNNVMEIRNTVIERVNERMHLSPKNSIQSKKTKQEPAGPTSAQNIESKISGLSSFAQKPLIVLPGLCGRALPTFRQLPLRWWGVPISAMMDNHKRELARTHPDDVMYVNAPTLAGIEAFEDQRGHLWEQRLREDTLLALRDVPQSTCARISGEMRNYYGRHRGEGTSKVLENERSAVLQHDPPVPPLSARPGIPGSKIFSVDKNHPNDEGYDFWGRLIADSIVKELYQ